MELKRDELVRIWSVDLNEMKKIGNILVKIYNKSKRCTITSELETNFIFARAPDADGTIFFNGGSTIVGKILNPIRCTIKKGMIREITGGLQADGIYQHFKSFQDSNSLIAPCHISIGLNPKGRLLDSIDSKTSGVVTIGVGVNTHLPQGTIEAKMHSDLTIIKATVKFDDKTIVEEGNLLI